MTMARTKGNTKPERSFFVNLKDAAKSFGLDEWKLFVEYCKLNGVYEHDDMVDVWNRYNGNILLTEGEINRIVVIATPN